MRQRILVAISCAISWERPSSILLCGQQPIAGSILYWIDSSALQSSWMSTGPGVGYSISAMFAFFGLLVGVFQNRNSNGMAALGGQIQAQGAPPTPEQASQMQQFGKALALGGNLNALFLTLATIGMAIARRQRSRIPATSSAPAMAATMMSIRQASHWAWTSV